MGKRHLTAKHLAASYLAARHLTGPRVKGAGHLAARHFAAKHLAARHLIGPQSTGLGHLAINHFKSWHLAPRHIAGGEVLPEEEKPTPPGPNGGARLDRNRAKRIGVFPDLPRFRAKKKRDDEFLLLMR